MKYLIQQRIETLNENAVNANNEQPSFTLDGITFSHWEFNHSDGWLVDAWLAETTIDAPDVFAALREFGAKINKIVPRVAFVGQAYTEAYHQPVLAVKAGSNVAYFYDPFDSEPAGLMFMDEEFDALKKLMSEEIGDEFFKYWNDAVNTLGYAPKLLIMFSAIEAFAKKPNGKKDWNLIEQILGRDLKDKIFEPDTGLRHRLVHGEYFLPQDSATNYVEDIHKSFMQYFNKQVFNADLLSTDVVQPHRHFFGNKNLGRYFIKPAHKSAQLNLKEVVADFNKSRDSSPENYEYVSEDSITKSY